MGSRKTEDLSSRARAALAAFDQGMRAAGVRYIITSTLRTPEEQGALYAQGRLPLGEVNARRAAVGMGPITAEQNAKRVTWTLHSRHLPITAQDVAAGRELAEDIGKARAFDIAVLKGDKLPTWDPKVDIDQDGEPDYLEAGKVGQAAGLEAGAFWTKPDLCHFETKSINQAA